MNGIFISPQVRLYSVPGLMGSASSPGVGGGDDDDEPPQARIESDPASSVVSRDVMFGDTPQDVTSAIGAPGRIFFKSEDKMRIHSPSNNARRKSGGGAAASQKSDYFYNYFTLGFVSPAQLILPGCVVICIINVTP